MAISNASASTLLARAFRHEQGDMYAFMRASYVSLNLQCKRSTLLVQRVTGEVQVLEEHPH